MQIRRFTISNYKSIFEVGPIELKAGFNIITGQNAAGKTALLEALSLQHGSSPHRSLKTVPNRGDITDPHSVCRIQFELANPELRRLLRNSQQQVFLPVPQYGSITAELGISDWTGDNPRKFAQWWLERPSFTFNLRFISTGHVFADTPFHSFVDYAPLTQSSGDHFYYGFRTQLNGEIVSSGTSWTGSREDLGAQLAPRFRDLIYRFSSERIIGARSPHGTSIQLAPNGSNLAEVLHVLQNNAAAFEEFNQLAKEVFSQIRWISVRAVQSGNEIIVWNVDKNTKRDDLGVPLDQTGSGVGQVLAILYVVFTSSDPSTIIIDEPQSYLHPAAAIKLVNILRRYPQHQFILATHSPSIIAASKPGNIISLTYDGETRADVFELEKLNSFHAFLGNAGLGIQDTFGADNILWVEGPTEHRVFPEIIDRLCNVPLMGTSVLPVSATGDLEGKDATRVFSIYRTLTRGNPLLPPALAFILDRETRTQQQINELTTQSNDLAMFLPRRMFENYLLRPSAIAQVMNSISGFRETPVTEGEIEVKMLAKITISEFFHPVPVSTDWQKNINAGRLLSAIFGELSEHRVEYRKTEHSVQLARVLLERFPEDLTEVVDVLKAALVRSR